MGLGKNICKFKIKPLKKNSAFKILKLFQKRDKYRGKGKKQRRTDRLLIIHRLDFSQMFAVR